MKLGRWGWGAFGVGAAVFACTSEETTTSTPAGVDAGTTAEEDAGTTPTPTADAATAKKRVFVTSDYFPGHTIGGLAKMDEACNTVAKRAKLAGTWRAWASDSKTSAVSRLADVGPWYTITGTLVAANRAALASGSLKAAISVNESGKALEGAGNVWTGTTKDGTAAPGTCNDWATGDGSLPDGGQLEGTVGLAFASDAKWTDKPDFALCNGSSLSLYCFEQ